MIEAVRDHGKRMKKDSRKKEMGLKERIINLRLQAAQGMELGVGLQLRQMELELNTYERQRARRLQIQADIRWACLGDAPTKFFYSKMKEKRTFEEIKGIRGGNGEWPEEL